MKLLDVINAPWAIQPQMLNTIVDIYRAHVAGPKIDIKSVEAAMGRPLNNEREAFEVYDGTAVIPLHGVMAKRMNMFSRISGGFSTELAARDIMTALDDERVERIVLDIESPGGSVDGVEELAGLVKQASAQKPVIALANGVMASAAYWVGSAAQAVYMTSNTTQVGSIGVVATHVDKSKREAADGIKTTEITAGRYKRIVSGYEPLTAEGREALQSQVDYLYSLFVEAVAENRGASVDDVLENMADGRVFIGQQAIDAGLVDGVSTLDQLLADLGSGQPIGTTATHSAGAAEEVQRLQQHLEQTTETNATSEAEQMDITLEYLNENHAELVASIRAEGEAAGIEAGATTERARIEDVLAQSMPGHEALVKTLAFDGKTTGPEAAVQVLNAERKKLGDVVAKLDDDAPEPLPAAVDNSAYTQDPQPVAEDVDPDDAAGLDAYCKSQWDASKDLRHEFAGDYEGFVAYTRADLKGSVKRLTKG